MTRSHPLCRCPCPLWVILHLTNPPDTLRLLCNNPMGVCLIMWAVTFTQTSFPVKNISSSSRPLTRWVTEQRVESKRPNEQNRMHQINIIMKQLSETEPNIPTKTNTSCQGLACQQCLIIRHHHNS